MQKLRIIFQEILSGNFKLATNNLLLEPAIQNIIIFLILFGCLSVFYFIIKKPFLKLTKKLAPTQQKITWYNDLIQNRVFESLLSVGYHFVLFLLAFNLSPPTFIYKFFVVLLAIKILSVLNRFVNCINQIYQGLEIAQKNPIKGYLQLFKIFLYIAVFIITTSVIIEKISSYFFRWF